MESSDAKTKLGARVKTLAQMRGARAFGGGLNRRGGQSGNQALGLLSLRLIGFFKSGQSEGIFGGGDRGDRRRGGQGRHTGFQGGDAFKISQKETPWQDFVSVKT